MHQHLCSSMTQQHWLKNRNFQISSVYTERLRGRQKLENEQNQPVSLFPVQLWVKRKHEHHYQQSRLHDDGSGTATDAQMRNLGRKERGCCRDRTRGKGSEIWEGSSRARKELLIWGSEGGIDFPKTYGGIQQVQLYQGAQSPPLAPAVPQHASVSQTAVAETPCAVPSHQWEQRPPGPLLPCSSWEARALSPTGELNP